MQIMVGADKTNFRLPVNKQLVSPALLRSEKLEKPIKKFSLHLKSKIGSRLVYHRVIKVQTEKNAHVALRELFFSLEKLPTLPSIVWHL